MEKTNQWRESDGFISPKRSRNIATKDTSTETEGSPTKGKVRPTFINAHTINPASLVKQETEAIERDTKILAATETTEKKRKNQTFIIYNKKMEILNKRLAT